jgi:2-polyprenyl-3-methyl-5-hydroxy-6-metoxy-1,4-benzoquinol methylase
LRQGERFAFGENWNAFLRLLDEQRIADAERSLREMLGVETLQALSFLDVGSGSGLFSLAARRLGATVYSFDYDPSSVGCTRELRRRFFPEDEGWRIEEGSVLDENFVRALGSFDIVYSWGVLHHTGALWKALGMVAPLVRKRGKLFIALYNDEGRMSVYWHAVKKTYCKSPRLLRPLILYPAAAQILVPRMVLALLQFKHPLRYYRNKRGMSLWRDIVDWVGGYPFEVSRPEQVFDFYLQRGFELRRRTITTSSGINQFVFECRPTE